ncbi:carbohydrate-binding protein [Chitinophaga agrisoli]|nr:carbohydrate-binding protein [Chitinophaga agrisoli]
MRLILMMLQCLMLFLLPLLVQGQTTTPVTQGTPPPPQAAPAGAQTTPADPQTNPQGLLPTPPTPRLKPETEFKMQHGSYLGFGQVYLGSGEIGFEVQVTNTQKGGDSRLEFRIDKPKGKIIGTLKVPFTGDTTYALKVPTSLGRFYGTHDLYVVAKGSGPFFISSFSFIRIY